MNTIRIVTTLAILVASAGAAGQAWAGSVSNPRGMSFRAVGLFQGEVEEGRCKVPITTQAIADVSGSICRDATSFDSVAGSSSFPTIMWPDWGNLFGNFCGGFLWLQNNMINQAVNVFKVRVRYRIPGRGFPVLCRAQRRFNLWGGARVNPVNSFNENPFGQVNAVLTQLLPIYSPQLFNCFRDPARGNVAAPVTVVATLQAVGYRDDGRKIKSNKLKYSLTLLPNGSSSGVPSGGVPPGGVCAPPVQ
jgi:hypothetical protein